MLSPDVEDTVYLLVTALPCNAIPQPCVDGRLKFPQRSRVPERVESIHTPCNAGAREVTWD